MTRRLLSAVAFVSSLVAGAPPIVVAVAPVAIVAVPAAFVSAQAEATEVKITFVVTPAAQTSIGSGNVSTWVANRISNLNTAATNSGMTTTFAAGSPAYTVTAACCGSVGLADDPNVAPGSNALTWASKDPGIAKIRDGSGADMTIIVGAWPTTWPNGTVEPSYRSLMDCSKTGKEAAPLAFGGINVNQLTSNDLSVGSVVGKMMCAGEETGSGSARGTSWMTGSSSASCTTFRTYLSPYGSDRSGSVWAVSEPGIAPPGGGSITGYSMAGASEALSDMTSKCGLANTGSITYTCSPIQCTVNGNNATCTHTRTPVPGTAVVINDNAAKNTFTCPGAQQTPLTIWSSATTPQRYYLGVPIGDSTHNSAGAIDARAAVTAAFRQLKLLAILVVAALE